MRLKAGLGREEADTASRTCIGNDCIHHDHVLSNWTDTILEHMFQAIGTKGDRRKKTTPHRLLHQSGVLTGAYSIMLEDLTVELVRRMAPPTASM